MNIRFDRRVFGCSQGQPIYSARVSLNYRVLGLLEFDHLYWYWIGAHDEYDELLKRI